MEKITEKLKNTALFLRDLHAVWQPHDGQIAPGKALFYDGKQFIFLECGRKYGKTDFVIYCLYRAALSTPEAACYFIAPFLKQAKELIWANNRLQSFFPKEIRERYMDGEPNNSEMRIRFKNGSFIKLDGSDNYVAYDGINPHFIAYDEFKDHHPSFHERMEPNLATYSAPLLVIGTPPESDDNHYVKIADSVKTDPDGAWFNYPSWSNPHISKEWLKKTKARLIARGELDVWRREYEAKRVKGGKNSIFPMFDDEVHVLSHDKMMLDLRKEIKRLDFYVTCDPATSSVFAVLFTAIHRYTRVVYHLDEIYINSTRETTSRKIWERIKEKIDELHSDFDDWSYTYDEAGRWFQNEILDITEFEFGAGEGISFTPTSKILNKKEEGLSLIKDQMLFGFWRMSDRCTSLRFEVVNYIRDKNGKIPKISDHLIDCMRYTNGANYYATVPLSPTDKKEDDGDNKRFYKMNDDVFDSNDWDKFLESLEE